jgi:hypothetical protein
MPCKPAGSGVESAPEGTGEEGKAGTVLSREDPGTTPGEDSAWSCTASEAATCSSSVGTTDEPDMDSSCHCPESKDPVSGRSKEDRDT